jgi:lysophospholipase L1-like esterase
MDRTARKNLNGDLYMKAVWMRRTCPRRGSALAAVCLSIALSAPAGLANDFSNAWQGQNDHWAATWSTALDPPELAPGLANAGFNNQTLRQIVHTSIGGRRARVRLSTFAAGDLVVGAAHIALSIGGGAIDSGSDRVLTFGGKRSITIPAGAPVVSDPVDLELSPLSEVAVSIFVPGPTGPASWHFDSRQTSYISSPGNFVGSSSLPPDSTTPTTQSWFWLSGVDVIAPVDTRAIVAFGDSLTDGDKSTVDGNARWTDWLARRFAEQRHSNASVLNAGLDGNRLLHDGLGPNGLARFESDALSQPGVTHVILLEGTSDIGTGWSGGSNPDQAVTVVQILQGYRQLIERAHNRGIKIIGATLPPFQGGFVPGTPFPLYSPENELKRQAVNSWIRNSQEFDSFIDVDRVLRDPAAPAHMIACYDSGDHIHPNDDGYRAIADAIRLAQFR